jgi:hypothetical protein
MQSPLIQPSPGFHYLRGSSEEALADISQTPKRWETADTVMETKVAEREVGISRVCDRCIRFVLRMVTTVRLN